VGEKVPVLWNNSEEATTGRWNCKMRMRMAVAVTYAPNPSSDFLCDYICSGVRFRYDL
jgi:hypothetical protein